MPEIITLSNGTLGVKISTYGAEILSVKKGNVENVWDANPEYWHGHAPILFPICGRLKDNKYTFDGKEYEMSAHGFGVSNEIKLNYRQFDIDTLIFEKLKSKKVTLKNRNTNREITVLFDDADILCIWTVDKAGFLCIEPWNGAPDFVDTDGDITKKAYIISLEPNVTDTKKHTIIF